MKKKRKTSTQTRAKKLAKVHALIAEFEQKACTEAALNKFAEVVVAEHGMWDGPDEIIVMGYFDPIEAPDDDEFCDDGYDLSMESLGMALQELGIGTISENNYALDEATGKFYCPSDKNCSNYFLGHVPPVKPLKRQKPKTRTRRSR
jgi:hypothetical protein